MLEIKYIPFLHVLNPPCKYDLQRFTDEVHKHKTNTNFARWEVEDFEQKLLKRVRNSKVVYVARGNIELLHRRDSGLVLGTYPALQHSKEDLDTRFPGTIQFNFGMYYDPGELFLVDDIIEWSHHHRSWLAIRTVKDLMN